MNGLDNIMDQTPEYTGIMVCIALEEAKVVLFMTDLYTRMKGFNHQIE